ncbi:MAG: hypothetical protein NZL95_06610 [Chitinophagales bacterium]|nr:hypothetical protein [Chitinophagales bacterium]MDW8428209.1 hypothetical protein [Chitinophagales bacterium]
MVRAFLILIGVSASLSFKVLAHTAFLQLDFSNGLKPPAACTSERVADASASSDTVFICNSPYARKFHKTRFCEGLQSCKAAITAVSRSEAVAAARTGCLLCYGNSSYNRSIPQPERQNIVGGEGVITGADGVWLCEGNYATRYHRYRNCRGLSNCKGTVRQVSKKDAIAIGRTACGYCY